MYHSLWKGNKSGYILVLKGKGFLSWVRACLRVYLLSTYPSSGIFVRSLACLFFVCFNSNALLPSKGLDISNQMMFVRGHTDNIAHVNYPYNELLLWSVLCNMRKMALFMWECGDEHLARALVAGKMFNGMAKVTERDDAYADITDALNAHVE